MIASLQFICNARGGSYLINRVEGSTWCLSGALIKIGSRVECDSYLLDEYLPGADSAIGSPYQNTGVTDVQLKQWINDRLSFLFFLPFIWMVTGLLLYKDAHKVMVIFAIITMLVSLAQYGLKLVLSNIKGNRLLQVLLVTLVFYIAIDVYHGYGSSVIRAFSVVTVLLVFTPSYVWQTLYRNLSIWVLVGSLACFAFTFYQAHVLQLGRWWLINPIPYTTVACVFSLVSAMLMVWKAEFRLKAMALVSFILSFNSIILGEARGVILAFSVALLAFFVLVKVVKSLPMGRYVLILSVTMLALFYLNKQTIENRLEHTGSEVVTISGGNLNSSIGLRFQMWQSGLEMFPRAPILGFGDGHFEQKEQQYEQGLITKQAIPFTHYHNQFIEALVKTGIIGLIAIMVLFLLPWYYCYQSGSSATLGAGVISLAYMVASLTDVPMSHAQTIIVYFIFMAPLLSNFESDNSLLEQD